MKVGWSDELNDEGVGRWQARWCDRLLALVGLQRRDPRRDALIARLRRAVAVAQERARLAEARLAEVEAQSPSSPAQSPSPMAQPSPFAPAPFALSPFAPAPSAPSPMAPPPVGPGGGQPSPTSRALTQLVDRVGAARLTRGSGALLGWLEGRLVSVLESEGVTLIDDDGPFDAARHEAIGSRPAERPERARTIRGAVRPGFALRGAVLRPQQVVVWRDSP